MAATSRIVDSSVDWARLAWRVGGAVLGTGQAARSFSRAYSTENDAPMVDCVVVGAGVIGLACARALALAGKEVVLTEAEAGVGTGTSSRHSEVIHAGIYYPPGSLKARLCVEGRDMLYDYCAAKGINHKAVGKLIVSTSEGQLPALRGIHDKGRANGVPGLQMLSAAEAVALEPNLQCAAALLSPRTGIFDSHAYMEALRADAEAAGASVALSAAVVGGTLSSAPHVTPHVLTIEQRPVAAAGSAAAAAAAAAGDSGGAGNAGTSTSGAGAAAVETMQLRTRCVVNAAGLWAQHVAASLSGLPPSTIPRRHLAKGNYFSLSGRSPFSRLIYPVPDASLGGLGIHLTVDLAGSAKFGPDVEWVDDVDYKVDSRRADSFYPAVRAYYPSLKDGALQPSYAGIRPKVSGPGEPAADFVIQGPAVHGVNGLVALYGIESPGLTSSLAIAQHVARLLTTTKS